MNNHEILVVMHHSINNHPKANPLGRGSYTVDEFIEHLRYFQNAGYEMISVKELMQRACEENINKSRIAVLTFDDGFLDNYLIVPKILRQFKATGTIFVNPSHATNAPARTLDEYPNAWGFLNFEEMRELERQRILDVQSHTMTHDFSFISDQLVDFYTPQKFFRYYWLIWKLCPVTKTEWHGDVYRFADQIPTGYPIFQWGRCMQGREFIPSKDFIDFSIKNFLIEGHSCITRLELIPDKGIYESDENYQARIKYQLFESKSVLERELSKNIDTVCFPGDVYNENTLSCAASAGYKVYMRHPREAGGDNLTAVLSASNNALHDGLTGLQRLGVFSEFPKILPRKTMAYWATKVAVRGFIGDPFYSRFLAVGRSIMQIVRSLLLKFEAR